MNEFDFLTALLSDDSDPAWDPEERGKPARDTERTLVMQRFYPRPFTARLLAQHRFLATGPDSRGEFYRYDADAGIWRPDAEAFIASHVRKDAEALQDEQKRRYVVEEITADVRGLSWHPQGLSEPSPYLVPFANGVYDLRANELREFRPEDGFTWKLPWRYNPEAQSTFIADKLANFEPHIQTHFWELLGYCLWRGYPYQKFFMWFGRGNNGKGFLANVITYALGADNISGVTLADLQTNRFAAASLYHRLANIAGEVNYHDLENTDLLKKLCGNDWLLCEHKYREPVPFKNYAKLIFLTNAIPRTRDTTDAFYRRAFLVRFEHQFIEDPGVLNHIDLLARGEQGAPEFEWVLYRGLQTLRELLTRDFVFTGHQEVAEVRRVYERLSNPLRQFIEERCACTYRPDDFIFKHEFKEQLNEWLVEKGLNAYTDKRLGRDMAELGFQDGQRGEKKWTAWVGVRWIQSAQSNDSKDSNLSGNNFSGIPEKLLLESFESFECLDLKAGDKAEEEGVSGISLRENQNAKLLSETQPDPDDPWRDYPYRREPEPPDGGWVGEDVHWPRLVRWAYNHDPELGATLKTFAEMGRHLVRWDGTLAIVPADEADREDYAADREYLLPYLDWLKDALRELASVTKEVPMAA